MNIQIGNLTTKVTSGRGLSPREIAEMTVEKMVHVADTAHPAIRDQMYDVKARMIPLIERAIIQGIKSDRTTVYNMVNDAGHPLLAEAIRKG